MCHQTNKLELEFWFASGIDVITLENKIGLWSNLKNCSQECRIKIFSLAFWLKALYIYKCTLKWLPGSFMSCKKTSHGLSVLLLWNGLRWWLPEWIRQMRFGLQWPHMHTRWNQPPWKLTSILTAQKRECVHRICSVFRPPADCRGDTRAERVRSCRALLLLKELEGTVADFLNQRNNPHCTALWHHKGDDNRILEV